MTTSVVVYTWTAECDECDTYEDFESESSARHWCDSHVCGEEA